MSNYVRHVDLIINIFRYNGSNNCRYSIGSMNKLEFSMIILWGKSLEYLQERDLISLESLSDRWYEILSCLTVATPTMPSNRVNMTPSNFFWHAISAVVLTGHVTCSFWHSFYLVLLGSFFCMFIVWLIPLAVTSFFSLHFSWLNQVGHIQLQGR